MASSDKPVDLDNGPQGSTPQGPGPGAPSRAGPQAVGNVWRSERTARAAFIWPALLVVLLLSIFPLIVSLYLSFSRLDFAPGRIDIKFLGLTNYQTLLFGTEHTHFLGLLRPPSPIGLAIFGAAVALTVRAFVGAWRGGHSALGLVLRAIGGLLLVGLLWLLVQTSFSPGGRPGTLMVTLVYVFVGITIQYLLGLGLALLATQRLAGRRFFRVVFLLPMTITPVGVAYMFRMLTDTGKGPFQPVWAAVGLESFSWVTDPWGARVAVMISDIWQWTPFMFIVLLAALEGRDQEVEEAGLADGANRWQIFRYITLPAILPVSTTVVLIRMIEAFKIIDLPNILTNGGPGTATESLTLQAFFQWRTLNLGQSAAIAYILLIVVTIVATSYVNLIRRRATATT